jgi:hypothetical protein
MVLPPMMTVLVLAVLWLVVVVPMVMRHRDERKRERSVAGFGRSMRLLGRRVHGTPELDHAGSEVFVTRERSAGASPARRPIPAAREAHMYPVDRSEMSAARTQMMARRRRSLLILGVGSVVFLALALMMGGIFWMLAAPFVLALGGYLYFLRTMAVKDGARRTNRIQRAEYRHGSYDVTDDLERFEQVPSTVVNIDDDDLELHNLDTVDLTGLYSEEHGEQFEDLARRAS